MTVSDTRINEAKSMLISQGYIVLKQKSYQSAQERQRVAESVAYNAVADLKATQRWAETTLHNEIRDLMARCTFLYGAARAHGATVDELRGSWLSCPECGS